MARRHKPISLFLSGAADKIKFFIGALKAMYDKGIVPNEIVGTSSGSIAALFYVCRKLKEAEGFNFSAKDIFGFNPFGIIGIAILIKNLITGKGYFWKYYTLRGTIKKFISEKDFQYYKSSNRPVVYVAVTDTRKNKEELINIKECETLDEAIEVIIASSTIYGFNDVVTIKGRQYVDGGAKSHIATELGIDKMTTKAALTVYSRPDGYDEIELPDPILKRLAIWLEQLLYNISHNDEIITDKIAKEKNIEVIKIFTPYKLLKGFFNVTKEENKLFYKLGYKEAEKHDL